MTIRRRTELVARSLASSSGYGRGSSTKWLIDGGATPKDIQTWANHKSIKITYDTCRGPDTAAVANGPFGA